MIIKVKLPVWKSKLCFSDGFWWVMHDGICISTANHFNRTIKKKQWDLGRGNHKMQLFAIKMKVRIVEDVKNHRKNNFNQTNPSSTIAGYPKLIYIYIFPDSACIMLHRRWKVTSVSCMTEGTVSTKKKILTPKECTLPATTSLAVWPRLQQPQQTSPSYTKTLLERDLCNIGVEASSYLPLRTTMHSVYKK